MSEQREPHKPAQAGAENNPGGDKKPSGDLRSKVYNVRRYAGLLRDALDDLLKALPEEN